jgi:hypothetical protein
MKQLLAFVALVAVALGVWFLRGNTDASLLTAKDAQIAALNETLQAKEKVRVQDETLLDTQKESLQTLKEKIKSDEIVLANDQTDLAADKIAYQKLQSADQTLISSLNDANKADIDSLKAQIQDKDEQIAQLNERLVQTIASYENRINALVARVTDGPDKDSKKIYPLDDGFEQQDLGPDRFIYFGDVHPDAIHFNPPTGLPNNTGWKFSGNAGISTNGGELFISNAKNGNHDGKTSSGGQVAFLQTKGSWLSQMIKLPPGTYSVSFDFEARRNYGEANGIAVSLNGIDLFVGAPTDSENFAHVTTDTITLTSAKEYELKFRGLGGLSDPDGDHMTFVDNICINVVKPHKGRALVKTTAYQSDTLNSTKPEPSGSGE